MFKTTYLLSLCIFLIQQVPVLAQSQETAVHLKPGNGNPILPGYYADPTVKKIGDTYYLYATTDGTGWGAGPSTVWTSKDFVNWAVQPMNWPNTHWYWAPDMTQGYDGRYYLYYSQPVELYGAVSDSPVGPWTSLAENNQSIIPNYMIPGVITLDGQTFTDDDGKIYMFWGTWGIYPDHGCAVGLLNEDMKTFERVELIPNTVAKEFFEAPVMFKRNGTYYMLYSSGHCEDHTYRVQYVKSDTGPFGPYEYPDENPILVTNDDGTIHGPGHNDVIAVDGRYYIVYHRHNNPHSGGGFHRQVAVDELLFDEKGNILNVVPTHEGVGFLGENSRPYRDLALGKPVTASSSYNADFRPEFAVDNHNGTLWRAANNTGEAWLQIDLERVESVQSILLEMEYPTYAYQYILEVSTDGKNWTTYRDNRDNSRWASPIIEKGQVETRYIKLRILNTQMVGLPRGVWNMKVFGENLPEETIWSGRQEMPSMKAAVGNLIHITADDYQEGKRLKAVANKGMLGGDLTGKEDILVKQYSGKKAFYFDGSTSLRSTFAVPPSLASNSAYAVEMWVNNPTVERFESVLAWSKGRRDLGRAVFGVGNDAQRGAVTHGSWPDMGYKHVPSADEWHHIVISFDGYMERIYVDGQLQSEQNRMLFVQPGDAFVVGASELLDEFFSGYLAELKVHHEGLSADQIALLYAGQMIKSPLEFFALQTDDLDLGRVTAAKNHGSISSQAIQLDEAVVDVIGQKTAVRTQAIKNNILAWFLPGAAYTLDFDVFDGKKWQHAVFIHQQDRDIYYINGQVADAKRIHKFLTIKDGIIYPKVPIHFLNVFRDSFTADQVSERYKIWLDRSHNDLKEYTPSLYVSPHYINDDAVFVQVEEEKPGLLYLFSCGGESSGWQKQPYYLFDGGLDDPSIRVYAKDEFGNVSLMLSSKIGLDKPILQSYTDEKGTFTLPDQEIPFWDAYQVSSYLDSTMTDIRLEQGVWHLGSKHTKWGDADLLAPFIYKALEGDFTIQVRVKDVAGLAAQSRTSSEAGIMIQDDEKHASYLNNTILTGWNLGNLARSIGEGTHQEGNNGTGLDFEPYLQIQKVKGYFYLRSSKDGKIWTDLPNTPFRREDLQNRKLKVGLYQIAANNQEGYGAFEDVKIWVFE